MYNQNVEKSFFLTRARHFFENQEGTPYHTCICVFILKQQNTRLQLFYLGSVHWKGSGGTRFAFSGTPLSQKIK